MARKLSITANNSTFSAYPGQILLDAALDQGIDMPHDCRAGQCGTCLVRMKRGELLGGEAAQRGFFHACQARVLSNAEITYDTVPRVERVYGLLAGIERLAPDVRGLCIKTKASMRHRPGQYYRVKFRGYPARCFSPTPPFVGRDDLKTVRFHVKLVRDGKVTSRLETRIQPGHKVILEGPFGSAFFRPREGQRRVLVASGTGFAPIWAIAKASLRRQPHVPLLLLAGSRRLSSLYAAPALCRLASYPAADFIATTEDAQLASEIIRPGTPADHLPPLFATDAVYAAGSPKLVQAVERAAARVGAAFFADPFVPSGAPRESWLAGQLGKISLAELAERLWAWSLAGRSGQQLGMKTRELRDGLGVLEDVRVGRGGQADKRFSSRRVA
jgi:3-phenylpropionate/trans-cinnamate dioxygenase ferredoxin reductase subunit